MRQRRVAALALPLPAADSQQMRAVRAVDMQCHGRHERAAVFLCQTRALGAAPAGEGLLEELADLAIGVREVAGGGVAVVRGDDESPAGRQALDEGPEVIAAESIGGITGEGVEALARA